MLTQFAQAAADQHLSWTDVAGLAVMAAAVVAFLYFVFRD